jgi:drug/metabolite transporter (DMT)-like permease
LRREIEALPRATVSAARPLLAGAGAIALWSSLALLSARARTIPPLQLTAMAFAVSAAAGMVWLAAIGRFGALRQRPLAWLHGVGGLFGYHACYFAALALAPAAEANLINYLWPLLIVLFAAPLLGMRLHLSHALGIGLGAGGYWVLFGAGDVSGAWRGDLFALAAAVIWALYSVLSRKLAHVPTGAVAGFSAAAAFLAAIAHAAFEPNIWPDGPMLGVILLIGLGPLGAAFYLWDVGMKQGDPRLLGTMAYATPVASTLLLCLSGEAPFSPRLLIAAVLVALGGVVAGMGRRGGSLRSDTA